MADALLADMPAQIALALSLASSSTGTDYSYLATTARTESSFQTQARAPTSSAQGLFQFIEETWIRTIKDEGGKYGLASYAGWIAKSADGRYSVDTPEHRVAILKLRTDPKVSAMMAAAYAKQNGDFVASAIGRRATSDELYLAHFLGPSDAVRFIEYRDRAPAFSAPDLFPAAAKANHAIFYGDNGPRTIGQVYDILVSRQHGGGAVAPADADTGAFFTSGIDFGSWQPKVQKIYRMKTPAHSVDASAGGPSLLDFLAGKVAPAADKPAIEARASSETWNAEVSAPARTPVPYVSVADDYPTSLIPADHPGEVPMPAPVLAPANILPAPPPLRLAAAQQAEEPRLKIIHVPQQ